MVKPKLLGLSPEPIGSGPHVLDVDETADPRRGGHSLKHLEVEEKNCPRGSLSCHLARLK
jgi:hypothetical protein